MKRSLLGVAVTLFLTAGCGSSSDYVATGTGTDAPPSGTAANFFVQGPTVNGQVTVTNSSGQVLAEGPALAGLASLTLPSGSLSPSNINAQGTVSPLKVTMTVEDGDHLDAGDGQGTFYAEVPQPVEGDVVGVDAVSSLIALYHEAHPELSFDEAAQAVFGFLALAQDTNPEHLFEDTAFDSGLFFAEARANGGIDALLAQLVGEVSPGASNGRFLQANVALPGIFDIFAKKLADTALGYIESNIQGTVFGWLEGFLGNSGPSIADVLTAIDQVRQDIERLSGQISAQGNLQTYNLKYSQLDSARASATQDTNRLTEWAADVNNPPIQADVDAEKSGIRSRYDNTLTLANNLELPQIGNTGQVQPGLIGLYLDAAVPRLYGAAQKDKANYHLNRSLNFQQIVLNLKVEAMHSAVPSRLLEAERAIDEYFSNAKLQRQQYPLAFDEEKVLLDRANNRLWTRRPVVFSDVRGLDFMLRTYVVDGAPAGSWRVPSAEEMETIISATGGTGIDQHTELGMRREGFLPINGSDTVGDWNIGTFNWKVMVGSAGFDRSGLTATFIHVSNFRRSNEIICTLDPFRGQLSEPRGPVAFYLVRDLPHVTGVTVSEKTRTATTVSYQAMARLSDGSQRDVTNTALWEVKNSAGTAVVHSTARISNVPESDGVLTYRVSNAAAMTVSASVNDVKGTAQAPVLTFADPAVTNLVISPVTYRVPSDGYVSNGSFQKAFYALSVRANGAVADANNSVTWTSSDPSVTVSPSGNVVAARPNTRKTVTITARLGNVSQTARLRLEP